MVKLFNEEEEEEEEEVPVIYRRREIGWHRTSRAWIVADDDDDDDANLISIIQEEEEEFGDEEEERENEASCCALLQQVVTLTDPDVLECPICVNLLFPPIFQCENGHITCSSCCSKLKTKCPFCFMPIGTSTNRCRGVEKFIESISRISCKNSKYGCKELMRYNKKSDHELTCPHSPCCCPHPSCSYAAVSFKNLYLHFGIEHAASTTRFTYETTFSLCIDINQKQLFLQEEHESIIFTLNHEAHEHERAINVDCVGPLKISFVYQLTVKSMETSISLQSVPGIFTEWSKGMASLNCLLVPSGFADHNGLLSLFVCIKKDIPSESEEEVEEVGGEFENENDGNANAAPQVVLSDPEVLNCLICQKPLCSPVFQCQNGHLVCSSCCSKAKTICPFCFPIGYTYNRCRGLEKVIESVRISCKNDGCGCKKTILRNLNTEQDEHRGE